MKEKTFKKRLKAWKAYQSENAACYQAQDLCQHETFQAILAGGNSATWWIMMEFLEGNYDLSLCHALAIIENVSPPIRPESFGKPREASEDWLRWYMLQKGPCVLQEFERLILLEKEAEEKTEGVFQALWLSRIRKLYSHLEFPLRRVVKESRKPDKETQIDTLKFSKEFYIDPLEVEFRKFLNGKTFSILERDIRSLIRNSLRGCNWVYGRDPQKSYPPMSTVLVVV